MRCHICQMMYDCTQGGKKLRTYNALSLALWHTFKQTCMLIWQTFANELFAPLWHHLYPGHIFFRKPSSLPSVVSHLLFLHMGCSAVLPDLERLCTANNTSSASKIMAQDLLFLFNVAIPVVMSLQYICCCGEHAHMSM